ncbi:MAG: TfoX/Sxy family protein [Chloroflexota bacterium]|nr:TfoX/Sxy family protein [Chloroflexota bacterium]
MSGGGMTFQKAPKELVERFAEVMAGIPDAQLRKMFGYPAAFANGYMFTGLHEDRWVIRLPEEARSQLAAMGATPFEPMPGRPMRGYVIIPQSLLADRDALLPWLNQALAHVLGLPLKPGR